MNTNESFVKFKTIFDAAEINVDLEKIVNVDELMKASAAPTVDTGLGFEGSLLYHIRRVWYFAQELSKIYSIISPVETHTLAKIVVLHQLGKVGMFAPNTDEWQVNKLGKVFTFVETGTCLKTGERSKLLCSNAGVIFTPEEYEAMSIIDKSPEEYENMNKYRTALSTIIRVANDMAYAHARKVYNDKIKKA